MSENPENQIIKQDTKFKPGVSGNPGGRPKGAASLTSAIKRKVLEGEADTIAENLIRLAVNVPEQKEFAGKGDTTYIALDGNEVKLHQWAVDTILDRIDGKTPEKVEYTETPSDLSEFTSDDLQAFRDWLKERKAAQPK